MKKIIITEKEKLMSIPNPSNKAFAAHTALYSFMLELYLIDEIQFEKTFQRLEEFFKTQYQ